MTDMGKADGVSNLHCNSYYLAMCGMPNNKTEKARKYLTLVNRRSKPHFRRLSYRDRWYLKHGFVNPRKCTGGVAQDEYTTLEEHDKQYHKGHYVEGQKCRLRESLGDNDKYDKALSDMVKIEKFIGAHNAELKNSTQSSMPKKAGEKLTPTVPYPYVKKEYINRHVSPSMDAEYAEAFDLFEEAEQTGDLNEQIRCERLMKGMLEEYAKKAFAGTKIANEDSTPKVIYHGTKDGGFTSFDTNPEGKTHDTGAWFCDEERTARTYSGNGESVYLAYRLTEKFMRDNGYMADGYAIVGKDGKINQSTVFGSEEELCEYYETEDGERVAKVVILDPYMWCKEAFASVGEALSEARKEACRYFDGEGDKQDCVYSCYANVKDAYEVDAHGDNWDKVTTEWHVYDGDGEFVDGFYSQEEAERKAEEWRKGDGQDYSVSPIRMSTDEIVRDARMSGCGYDGVILKNVSDAGPEGWGCVNEATDYVIFDGKNIKMADMVTFDDNGNLIPLSRRFDFTKNDVRY